MSGKKVKPMRVGSMIEVPSAAIISDLLARECDFLSIGTNDLVQYALAVDRDNHMMTSLYSPTHPSVIELSSSLCMRLAVMEFLSLSAGKWPQTHGSLRYC